MFNSTRTVSQTAPMIAPPPKQAMIAPPPKRELIAPPPMSTAVSTHVVKQAESSRNATQALGQLTSPAATESGHQCIVATPPAVASEAHQSTPFAQSGFGQTVSQMMEALPDTARLRDITTQGESVSKVVSAVQDIRDGLSNRGDQEKVLKAAEGVDTLIADTGNAATALHNALSHVSPASSEALASLAETRPAQALTRAAASVQAQMPDMSALPAMPEGLVTASVLLAQSPSKATAANLVLVACGGNDVSDAVRKAHKLCTEPSLENASEALKSAQGYVDKHGVSQLSAVASLASSYTPQIVCDAAATASSCLSYCTAPLSSAVSQYVPTIVSDTASTVSGYLPAVAGKVLPVAAAVVNSTIAAKAMKDLYNQTPDSSLQETVKKTASAAGSVADAMGAGGLGTLTATTVNLGIDVTVYSAKTAYSAAQTAYGWGSAIYTYCTT